MAVGSAHPIRGATRKRGLAAPSSDRSALSRALDDLEESTLLPERKVLYQFWARGHDVTQALLGGQLVGARDAVGGYYRSRPLLLALGLSVDQALASSMMRRAA